MRERSTGVIPKGAAPAYFMKSSGSLGGIRTSSLMKQGARSSRVRSAMYRKLAKLDRKISFLNLALKSWKAFCNSAYADSIRDEIYELDLKRKEVRAKRKAYIEK